MLAAFLFEPLNLPATGVSRVSRSILRGCRRTTAERSRRPKPAVNWNEGTESLPLEPVCSARTDGSFAANSGGSALTAGSSAASSGRLAPGSCAAKGKTAAPISPQVRASAPETETSWPAEFCWRNPIRPS